MIVIVKYIEFVINILTIFYYTTNYTFNHLVHKNLHLITASRHRWFIKDQNVANHCKYECYDKVKPLTMLILLLYLN